jgi:hypothetical protein
MMRIHTLLLWSSLSMGLGLLSLSPAHAAKANCAALFQNKQFLQAGKCFAAKAEAMGPSRSLSKIQRYLKGQNLRNAALCYRKAAKTIQNQEQAAYLREQALRILQGYLKDNLCQRRYLCKLAKGETLELINQIKYVQLSIVTSPNKRASVTIKGYKTMVQYFSPPQWNKQIRPGRYTVTVQYAGSKRIKKEIIAAPGTPLTITALAPTPPAKRLVRTPPTRRIIARIPPRKAPPPPRANVVPWVVAGIGVAIAAVGGGLLLYAQSEVGARDQLYNTLKSETDKANTSEARATEAKRQTDELLRTQLSTHHNNAFTASTAGWIVLGVGGATVAVGLVMFAIKPTITPPAPAPSTNAKQLLSIR